MHMHVTLCCLRSDLIKVARVHIRFNVKQRISVPRLHITKLGSSKGKHSFHRKLHGRNVIPAPNLFSPEWPILSGNDLYCATRIKAYIYRRNRFNWCKVSIGIERFWNNHVVKSQSMNSPHLTNLFPPVICHSMSLYRGISVHYLSFSFHNYLTYFLLPLHVPISSNHINVHQSTSSFLPNTII